LKNNIRLQSIKYISDFEKLLDKALATLK